jgi:hypothetical protein
MSRFVLQWILVCALPLNVLASPSVTPRKQPVSNPNTFTFDASISEVEAALLGSSRRLLAGKFMCVRTREPGHYYVIPSPGVSLASDGFYGFRDEPLKYDASYNVSVGEAPGGKAKVAVQASNPHVYLPTKKFNLHTFRFDQRQSVKVESTGIEEYEVLHEIGSLVHQAGMPPVRYP